MWMLASVAKILTPIHTDLESRMHKPRPFNYKTLENAHQECTGKNPEKWVSGANGSLLEKVCNSVRKEFTVTLIRILYSNFKQIGCREIDETRVRWQNSLQNVAILPEFCAHLAKGVKSLQGSMSCERTSSCIISFHLVLVCWSSLWKCDFVRVQNWWLEFYC